MDDEKLQKSQDVMREASLRAKEAGTPLLINFSGGKDSSCLILLAQDVEADVELIYMKSGLELPGCIDFVKEQAKRFDMKLHIVDPVRDYQGDFAYWVRKRGYFPSYAYNYCSSRLKLRPSGAYLRKIYNRKIKGRYQYIYRVNGVRKSESSRRKKLYENKPPIRRDMELSGNYLVEPIHEWTGEDVVEYLASKNFEVQTLYNDFGVSGCAWCPYYQPEIYQRILNVYPDIYDEICELERELGKPSVGGNRFLYQIKEDFFANREEIMAELDAKKIIKRK